MGGGKVELQIGKTDREAFHRDARGEPKEKTWSYFPHALVAVDVQTPHIARQGVVAEGALQHSQSL